MKIEIKIQGMSCMHCVKRVKNAIAQLDGVTFVDVLLDESKALVEFEESKVTTSALDEIIIKTGYTPIK